jgi:hypothetical protein
MSQTQAVEASLLGGHLKIDGYIVGEPHSTGRHGVRGFALSPRYGWTLETDRNGNPLLVASRKA